MENDYLDLNKFLDELPEDMWEGPIRLEDLRQSKSTIDYSEEWSDGYELLS